MNRRDKEYRNRVALLAKEVIEDKLDFFEFLNLVGGEYSAYETGDDEVDELIDLLEHEPKVGGFLGVSEKVHKEYILNINEIINRLLSASAS